MYGLSSTESTVKSAPRRPSASERAPASSRWVTFLPAEALSRPASSKSRPVATRSPSTVLRRAVNELPTASAACAPSATVKVPSTPQ